MGQQLEGRNRRQRGRELDSAQAVWRDGAGAEAGCLTSRCGSLEEKGKAMAIKEGFSVEACGCWVLAHKEWASLNQDLLKRKAAEKDTACAKALGTRHENVRRALEVPVQRECIECVGSPVPKGEQDTGPALGGLGTRQAWFRGQNIAAQRADAVKEVAWAFLEAESGAKEGSSEGIEM